MTIYSLTRNENGNYRPVGATSDLLVAERWALDSANDYFPFELDNLQGLGLSEPLPVERVIPTLNPSPLSLRDKPPAERLSTLLDALTGVQSRLHSICALTEAGRV